MAVGTLSPQQLRSLIEDKWRRDAGAMAMGLHISQPWHAPADVEFEFGKAKIVHADSEFQIREALVEAEHSKHRIVLLTTLHEGELSKDVVARLARNRLFVIDHWASLCSLFKAKELDRSMADAVLAEALVEFAPADGYPPVSAGVLDAGTVWKAVCRHVFEMGDREPDLVSLLLWATSKAAVTRYLEAGEALRISLRKHLVSNLGDAAETILRIIECGAGRDALAIAAVCQVVFGSIGDKTSEAAAARLEQYHANKPILKSVGIKLGEVAEAAIGDLDRNDDLRVASDHLQRADELLKQLRCESHAYRSRLTLLGYNQRLQRFGDHVSAALKTLDTTSIRQCEEAQVDIAQHRQAKIGQTDAVPRTIMALRLLRWMATAMPLPRALIELIEVYRKELAFVDWARESICRGQEASELSKSYRQLDQAVFARREQFSKAFANALAEWTATGSTAKDICRIEDVLSEFVAKIAARGNRVLLVVLDGMSWAICHELLDDVRREHWFEVTTEESSAIPLPVIATIPSITTYSRTSLFAGELLKGDLAIEKRKFEESPVLRQVCDRRHPPVLFHKSDVTEGARGILADDLKDAILSPEKRIVGAVINAIDDRLAGAPQVIDQWTVNRISPMGAMLNLARDAGRVVILASDHGHVWHRPEARYAAGAGDAGSRWRSGSGPVQPTEIAITGARVMSEDGSHKVIVPWGETLYYGKHQNGYHGGATPQEMVCPLVVLTDKTSAGSGLFPSEFSKPEWWNAAPVGSQTGSEAILQQIPIVPQDPSSGQGDLFDESPPVQSLPVSRAEERPASNAAWVDQLFVTEVYKSQKDLIRRHAPEDELVARCLRALDASGGTMTLVAFANSAGILTTRLDGLISRIQRLLNVDGYEILTISRTEDRIDINVAKLKRQFGMD